MYVDTNDFQRYLENSNYYREQSAEELVDSLYNSMGRDSEYLVFSMRLVASSTHPINEDESWKRFEVNYKINKEHTIMYDQQGTGLLYIACRNGDIEVIKLLLAYEGIEINKVMQDGGTPLYIACQNGHVEVIERLLAHDGIDINKARQDGVTPLYIACQNGHVEVIKLLLAQDGIEINKARQSGTTPLYIACQYGRSAIVDLLLQSNKPDVNAIGIEGHTPLLVACLSPRTHQLHGLFRALLQNKANLFHTNDKGETALDIAFLQKNNAAIEAIFLYAQNNDLLLASLMSSETMDKARCWATDNVSTFRSNGFFDSSALTDLKKITQQKLPRTENTGYILS
jgi:ankyrin repeat protein